MKGKGKHKQADVATDQRQDPQPSGRTEAPPAAQAALVAPPQQPFKNKEKVLILSTRGVTFRYRHLMTDLINLIPHCKKDAKLDTKSDRKVIDEVADMKSCTSVIFFEVRKRQDLYLWFSKTPDGPSAKFHVANIHTMAELKLSGNHLKGSRPVLSFHKSFDELPHLQVLKELFTQIFAVPRRHHKSKPFFDHVLSFSVADGRIWFRNYQVVVPLDKKRVDPDAVTLVEVGPRFCLNPIRIFDSSFGGRTLYENPIYVSPNAVRAAAKRAAAGKYGSKVDAQQARKDHLSANPMPRSELEDLFKGEGQQGHVNGAAVQQQVAGRQQLLRKQQQQQGAGMKEDGTEEGDDDDEEEEGEELNTEDFEAMMGDEGEDDEGEGDDDEEMVSDE